MAFRLATAAAGAAFVGALAPPAFGAPPATATALAAAPVARADLRDLGRAPAATPVRIAVTLPYRDEAALEQLVELQATPGSPLFHHFLTPAQFAAYFAPLPADYLRVSRALATAGFAVAPPSSNRTVVRALASAPVAERYFGTQIHLVAQRGYGTRYANVTPAILPAGLAGVQTVLGLDNVVKFHSQRLPAVPDFSGAYSASDAKPQLSGPIWRTDTKNDFEGLYPTAIAIAYKYPTQSNFTGTGHGIAVVIDSDILNSDLSTFWSAAGITRTGAFNRVLVEGTNPGVGFDEGETAIDTEMTTSLAPGANVNLYLVPELSEAAIEDAYDLAVKNHNVDVVNSSFGGCEPGDVPFLKATESAALQGASEGITFVASSGDSGGFCEYAAGKEEPDIVNSPASDSYFTAVGATALGVNEKTGVRVYENAWAPGGFDGGSGGGVSGYWALPSYQKTVSGMVVVPDVKTTPPASLPRAGYAGRNLPDISLDGSNRAGSYVAVYAVGIGGWTGYGGTSVSAPLFSALVADRDQEHKTLSGFIDPTLYSTFTQAGKKPAGVYGTLFYDVTSGSTGAGWTAKTGYDQSTGIGSIYNGSL